VLGQPVDLAAQDLPRRGDDVPVAAGPIAIAVAVAVAEPLQVGEHHRRAVLPRHPVQRGQVGDHREVAVPAVPGGHLVAGDGVHVDVHREQVVAALAAAVEDLVQEEAGVEPLALEPALHVDEGEHDRVDLTGVDRPGQLLDRQRCGARRHRANLRTQRSSSTPFPARPSPA
jgi:hypothetical protein